MIGWFMLGVGIVLLVALVFGLVAIDRVITAAEYARLEGNDYRRKLARATGGNFYSYEDVDGSLSWRRASAR